VVEFFALVVVPLLGVLWFLNFVVLLEKMKKEKNYHNQKVLGAVLTFILITFLINTIAEMS
jgi:hypothetical protein